MHIRCKPHGHHHCHLEVRAGTTEGKEQRKKKRESEWSGLRGAPPSSPSFSTFCPSPFSLLFHISIFLFLHHPYRAVHFHWCGVNIVAEWRRSMIRFWKKKDVLKENETGHSAAETNESCSKKTAATLGCCAGRRRDTASCEARSSSQCREGKLQPTRTWTDCLADKLTDREREERVRKRLLEEREVENVVRSRERYR